MYSILPSSVKAASCSGVVVLLLALACVPAVVGQEGSTIPDEYRGSPDWVARGILDGNLIETNFRNHGEFARWNDIPHGVWPRSIGGRHIDGIAVLVGGLVRGERAKWAGSPHDLWPAGTRDTLLNPVQINYRGNIDGEAYSEQWGWLPLNGFHNPLRLDPVTGGRSPTPALSDDPNSWPEFWPDRLHEEDSGWPGSWNGMFGKGVFNADLEAYYVVDDLGDRTYHVDDGAALSEYGVFYPTPRDSSIGGLGLQMSVRTLQWANILAEDTAFLIYRITNLGDTNYGECIDLAMDPPNVPVKDPRSDECPGQIQTGLYFAQFVDFGLGNEESDETAAFDPILDVAFGWDHDGIGTRETGSDYDLGYTGFAFLESPADDNDGLDNDQDGLNDEQRFGGPGMLIEGQEAIRAQVESRYDMTLFENFYGPLEDRPAYRAGVWWTGDENLDWVGFDDANDNGVYDAGELLNDDYGRDGLGPYDPNYPGPDQGEADGRPTIREPNFDETDVDESDQIGLTGFHLSARPVYEAGENLVRDSWMWARIQQSQFELEEPPRQEQGNVEPFLNFSSGPVDLGRQNTDFFSTAWVFGWDEQDFFKNLETVDRIYKADYRFAQPPIVPTVKAQPGDGYVVLSWDTLSLASYDRFTQEFDFEGYKLYKGTDPLLSDAKEVTTMDGVATFYNPIAQWDLDNGINGGVPVLDNTAFYDLGDDTGVQFSYIDHDVTNGKTYYYALVAYDRGFTPDEDSPDPNVAPVDPQENTFNISVNQGGVVLGHTPNAAIVTPRSRAAGYIGASTHEDLSEPTEGIGTGSIEVTVVNDEALVGDAVYRLAFFDTTDSGADIYETTGYELRNVTTNEVLIPRSPLTSRTPSMDGFVVDIFNDETAIDPSRTGWVGQDAEGVEVVSPHPGPLVDYDANWFVEVEQGAGGNFRSSPYDYELVWTDTMNTTPSRSYTGYLQSVEIPLACQNLTTGEACDVLVRDDNENGEVDLEEDALVVADPYLSILHRFRYAITISTFGQESNPPEPGARLLISSLRPFSGDDYFQFTMQQGHVDEDLAREELDRIAVVPNPYVAAAEWEPRTQIEGRGPRMIQFIHLPQQCTIEIYTVRGELVQRIEHDGTAGDGAEWWNLRTRDQQEVAYGVYLYHVDAPGIGTKTGKFAIVK